jgi:hypothetical protein
VGVTVSICVVGLPMYRVMVLFPSRIAFLSFQQSNLPLKRRDELGKLIETTVGS